MSDSKKPAVSISPIYVLSIFLSVPAGFLLVFQVDSVRSVSSQIAVAMILPVVVAFVAYFHTRQMNSKG